MLEVDTLQLFVTFSMSNNRKLHVNSSFYVPKSVLNFLHLLDNFTSTETHEDVKQRGLVKLHDQRVSDPGQSWSTV